MRHVACDGTKEMKWWSEIIGPVSAQLYIKIVWCFDVLSGKREEEAATTYDLADYLLWQTGDQFRYRLCRLDLFWG